MTEREYLCSVFAKLNISLTDKQSAQFLDYYRHLVKKNQVMNLTAITEFESVVEKHFADSVMILANGFNEELKRHPAASLIDIGTGAGFPGLPLKILLPEFRVVLLDALQKRIDFLGETAALLGLNSVERLHGRAEDFAAAGKEGTLREQFDFAVSRAVSDLPVLTEYCLPFVKVGGCFIAYKSGNVEEEIVRSGHAINVLGGTVEKVEKFALPVSGDPRSLVYIRKTGRTPDRYPRKAGKPTEKPL